MTSPGPIRRLANGAARHAARVLPPGREDWGRAMQAETQHLERDTAALSWALGCVWASYAERGRVSMSWDLLARWGLAAIIAGYALARLPIALRTWAVINGDFIDPESGAYLAPAPVVVLSVSLPRWFLALFLVHNALYLCAAAALALGWRRATHAFLLALTIQFGGWLALRADPLTSLVLDQAAVRRDITTFALLAAAAIVMARLLRAASGPGDPRSPGTSTSR